MTLYNGGTVFQVVLQEERLFLNLIFGIPYLIILLQPFILITSSLKSEITHTHTKIQQSRSPSHNQDSQYFRF
jgi:hypothetical protein